MKEDTTSYTFPLDAAFFIFYYHRFSFSIGIFPPGPFEFPASLPLSQTHTLPHMWAKTWRASAIS